MQISVSRNKKLSEKQNKKVAFEQQDHLKRNEQHDNNSLKLF